MNVHVPVRRPIIAQRPLSSVLDVICGGYASLFVAVIGGALHRLAGGVLHGPRGARGLRRAPERRGT